MPVAWRRRLIGAALGLVALIVTRGPGVIVDDLESQIDAPPVLPMQGQIDFLVVSTLLAVIPFTPTTLAGKVARAVGLRAAEIAIGLAFGLWVFVIQAIHVHTHVLELGSSHPDLRYTTDISVPELEALRTAAGYYSTTVVVLLWLVCTSLVLRTLLERRTTRDRISPE